MTIAGKLAREPGTSVNGRVTDHVAAEPVCRKSYLAGWSDLSAGISFERDTAAAAIASVTQPVAADALGNDSEIVGCDRSIVESLDLDEAAVAVAAVPGRRCRLLDVAAA